MRYLLLLADEPAAVAALSRDERMQIVHAHLAISRHCRTKDGLVTPAALDPARATVVAPPADSIVTDGPFAETKEALGSFYVVEAGNDIPIHSVTDGCAETCRLRTHQQADRLWEFSLLGRKPSSS